VFYFIATEDGKITSNNESTQKFVLPEGYREIDKTLYNSIGAIPCSFTESGGEIVSIEFIEPVSEVLPSKTELEIIQEDNASLWYENMLQSAKVESNETEVASLWYSLMMGGI